MNTSVSYGQNPWQQRNWDWRAAGNFICGGPGSGLIVFAVLSGVQGPAAGAATSALLLGGLALIGLGLTFVWLEIGRPWRAMNVFFNPRTSWMSREAITATLLFPVGLAAAAGVSWLMWPAAALALFFVYCQSRMLMAARGIAAWREPAIVTLIVSSGLTEGGGVFWLTNPWHGRGSAPLLALFGALIVARLFAWLVYRQRLGGRAALRANQALDRAGRSLQIAGTIVPLALVVAVAVMPADATTTALAAIAGIAALVAGAIVKYTLVTRAGFVQGFALVQRPTRGVSR